MRLTIKAWKSNADEVLASSLFGVVDADQPGTLPIALGDGHWETFRIIEDVDFKLSAEAKAAIAKHGYYIFGAGAHVDELL